MKNILNTRLRKNLSWIFIGNVLHSLFNFILSIYVARVLPLDTNGTLTYAASIIALFTCFTGLGYGGTISREFSESPDEAGDIICSCLVSRIIASAIAIAMILVYVQITDPGNKLLLLVVFCNAVSMLIGSSDLFVFWYRYKNQADVTAIYRLVAFGISAVLKVLMLSVYKSVDGYVIVSVSESVFFTVFLMIFYFRHYKGSFKFSFSYVKRMLKGSYPFIFTALMTTIYARTDTVMLKNMVDASAVALYGCATRLAGFISTIPTTIIEAFRPDIMDAKINDEYLYKKRLRQLYAIIFWVSIAYCVFCTIFAKQMILILYTEKYLGAVSSLALVVWYSAFSYMGTVNSMYMVAEKKAKWVQITTLSGAITNIVLNYFMIQKWGIMGASFASFMTQFVAHFIIFGAIPEVRGGFKIMIDGICFRDVFDFKELFKKIKR